MVITVLYVWCLVFTMLPLATTERVLMCPLPFGFSHVAKHVAVAEELVKLGHDVTVVIGNDSKIESLVKNSGIQAVLYQTSSVPDSVQKDNLRFDKSVLEALTSVSDTMKTMCDDMVSDVYFMKQVSDVKYDMMVIDGSPFSRCLVLLPKMLNVPFVVESPGNDIHLAGAPIIPSTHPMMLFSHNPNRTFTERLMAVFETFLQYTVKFPINSSWLIEKHLPTHKESNFEDLLKQAQFWLFGNTDPLMDFGLISTPNIAHVGGLTTQPAKELPKDLATYMTTSKEGVIIVSFGSIPAEFPIDVYQLLLDAFSGVKQNVLMTVPSPEDYKPSSNVRLQKWLPQNDLLGHKNAKLFITHCGGNSQYEALYHGVPMIGLALFPSDVKYNAKRIQNKGYGIALDFNTLTSENVLNSILTVTKDTFYHDNIKKASLAYRSASMTPRQRAAYWVDYVIKHGGSHLRPPSLDLPLWQHMMFDVLALFFIVVLLLLCGLYFALRVFYRMCVKKRLSMRREKTD